MQKIIELFIDWMARYFSVLRKNVYRCCACRKIEWCFLEICLYVEWSMFSWHECVIHIIGLMNSKKKTLIKTKTEPLTSMVLCLNDRFRNIWKFCIEQKHFNGQFWETEENINANKCKWIYLQFRFFLL